MINYNWKLISIILAVIVGASATTAYFYYNNVNFPVQLAGYFDSGCGMNVLGISNVDFFSNDAKLQYEDALLITTVVSAENECVIGNWKKEEINQELEESGDEERVKYDFSLSLDTLNESCTYNIFRDIKNPVQKVDYYMKTVGGWASDYVYLEDFINDCSSQTGYWKYKCYPNALLLDCFCFTKTTDGWIGSFGNARKDVPIEVKLKNTVTGEEIRKVMDGLSGSDLIDPNVYVETSGALIKNFDCPNPNIDAGGYKAVFVPSGIPGEDAGWRTLSTTVWDDYDDYDSSGFQQCLNGLTNAREQMINCKTQYNAKELAVFTSAKGRNVIWDWAGSYYNQIDDGSESSGRLVLVTEKDFFFPLITFHINAEWAGIFTPVGVPEITSIPSLVNMESGGSATFNVQVSNTGDGTGTFTMSASCSDGFSALPTGNDQVNVDAGESKFVEFTVNGYCPTDDVSATCTIKAKGKTSSDTSDPITISCKPPPQCTIDGQVRCSVDSRYVEVCQGGKWIQKESCENGCVAVIGGAQCRALSCTSDSDCNDNNPCTLDKCQIDIFGNSKCSNTEVPNCGVCGNGICEPNANEDWISCPNDCSVECTKNSDCDDGDECTIDTCEQSLSGVPYCKHTDDPSCVGGGVTPDWLMIGIIIVVIFAMVFIFLVYRESKKPKVGFRQPQGFNPAGY